MMIRTVKKEDAGQLLAIYSPYITDTVITFETEVPAEEEFCERICRIKERYPYLVYEEDGEILGYAYASSYRDRAAYDFDCELSVYVKKTARQGGIGTRLYEELLDELKMLGYVNVYSVITVPNPQSEAFHRKFGFIEEGRSENCGYKFGRWCSVAYLAKRIGEGNKDAGGHLLRPRLASANMV